MDKWYYNIISHLWSQIYQPQLFGVSESLLEYMEKKDDDKLVLFTRIV